MKVKLLKPWLKVPTRKPEDVFKLPDEVAQNGIERGLCVPVDGTESQSAEDLAEQLAATREELKSALSALAAAVPADPPAGYGRKETDIPLRYLTVAALKKLAGKEKVATKGLKKDGLIRAIHASRVAADKAEEGSKGESKKPD